MSKKHGHEHAHCEHCLHACDHCDVAYCCDCNREWGTCRRQHYWYYPYYQIPSGTPATSYPATTTSDTNSYIVVDNEVAVVPAYHPHGHEN